MATYCVCLGIHPMAKGAADGKLSEPMHQSFAFGGPIECMCSVCTSVFATIRPCLQNRGVDQLEACRWLAQP